MGKFKKIKNYVPTPKSKLQQAFDGFNLKLFLSLLGSFALIFGGYEALLAIAEAKNLLILQTVTLWVYLIATTVLFCAYVIVNKGISGDIPKEEQLPESWSYEKKREFIEEIKNTRKKSKKILIFLLPFIVTLLFDFIYLFFIG